MRTRDLMAIGIPRRRHLARMCDEGLLVRVAYGVYRAPPTRPLEPALAILEQHVGPASYLTMRLVVSGAII